jgi:hypothetical protein
VQIIQGGDRRLRRSESHRTADRSIDHPCRQLTGILSVNFKMNNLLAATTGAPK